MPSRVEGVTGVIEAVVNPDRLTFLCDDRQVVVKFEDIAKWPRPHKMHKIFARFGWSPRWLPIADRDWFHGPPDRYFRFYTDPPIIVYMPDESGVEYSETCFRKIQDVITRGGFSTFDLG